MNNNFITVENHLTTSTRKILKCTNSDLTIEVYRTYRNHRLNSESYEVTRNGEFEIELWAFYYGNAGNRYEYCEYEDGENCVKINRKEYLKKVKEIWEMGR